MSILQPLSGNDPILIFFTQLGSSASSPPSSSGYKKHKGGRPRDSLADAIIEAEFPGTDDERKAKRTKCSHCKEWSQTTRSAPRARTHAAFECPKIGDHLREKSLEKIFNTAPAGSSMKDRASRKLQELGEKKKQVSREIYPGDSGGEMDRHVLMKLGDLMIKYFPPESKAGISWVERIEQHLEIMTQTCEVPW